METGSGRPTCSSNPWGGGGGSRVTGGEHCAWRVRTGERKGGLMRHTMLGRLGGGDLLIDDLHSIQFHFPCYFKFS
jgi:hypothetical protein